MVLTVAVGVVRVGEQPLRVAAVGIERVLAELVLADVPALGGAVGGVGLIDIELERLRGGAQQHAVLAHVVAGEAVVGVGHDELRPGREGPVADAVVVVGVRRQVLIVVVGVKRQCDARLALAALAYGGPGSVARRLECRQQNGNKQCDDRNDHQKLDQRESAAVRHGVCSFWVGFKTVIGGCEVTADQTARASERLRRTIKRDGTSHTRGSASGSRICASSSSPIWRPRRLRLGSIVVRNGDVTG